ncbi:hypothetical protein [Glycomyces paridis]|uniref:Uncharacterized protein n=1 Tax=Glycomyces paridis TaxID=2126555 RepID=A0A4S8P6X0_9ACTN|nr:hypothetical protein [Glycomyces paridis]THV26023.1 hypothetical protein E9998_20040 [Glycomyces paridis]
MDPISPPVLAQPQARLLAPGVVFAWRGEHMEAVRASGLSGLIWVLRGRGDRHPVATVCRGQITTTEHMPLTPGEAASLLDAVQAVEFPPKRAMP